MKILFNLMTTIEVPDAEEFLPREEVEKELTDFFRSEGIIVAVEKESQVDGAYGYMDTKSIIDLLHNLPSAEPENIRCYECKYGIHSGCGDVYICHVSPELVMEHTGDFYCGYAERRTDELGNS